MMLSAAEKKEFDEMVMILRALDKKSLLLIDSGARMLKARMDMDNPKSADQKVG